ncbi:MAG TPA: DUF1028 domain-containing protein [Chitinophagaceae bacterium]
MIEKLKHILLTYLLVVQLSIISSATFSIIVIDPRTKEIGIAGASCTHSVYGIGAIVPGKGAIVVQAMSNGLARMEGFRMIMEGATAIEIIEKIREPYYRPEMQQYAILCMNDINHPATYTGKENITYAGALTANGISVQGNTLTSSRVLQEIFDAAVKAQKDSLPVQDILMIAMEAGARAGGDKRCGKRSASSAFITVSKQDDLEKHWLNLVINSTDDHTPAVAALRRKFDKWKSKKK